MIQSVEIKNLRGIQEGKLEGFTPLTVLVGPNGSGKSTILDALLIGASPNIGEAIGRTVQRRSGVNNGSRWLFWRTGADGPSEIKLSTDTDRFRRCQLGNDPTSSNNAILCRIEEPRGSIFGDYLLDGKDIIVQFADDNAYQYRGDYEAPLGAPEVTLIEVQDTRLQAPLDQIYSEAVELGRRQEVTDLLSAIVPGLSHIEILTQNRVPIVHLVFNDRSVPVALSGDGVKALLRLSLELASCPRGIALLEEPEVHQHPAALGQSAKAIMAAVRRGIQVIISTHSLELIDRLLNEVNGEVELNKLSVFGLKLDNGCLKSYHLEGQEVALMRTQVETDLR